MRIFQIMPELKYGDAVGNDAVAVCKVISEMGYDTAIYAEKIDPRLRDSKYRYYSKLPKLNDDDILILNHCCGTDLCEAFASLKGRKMMIYHNMTPPAFFIPYSSSSLENLSKGYAQTEKLSESIEYVMADSDYNASDLREMGYKCPISVRPILIPFEDYKTEPDADTVARYKDDGYVNIIFVGRIAPNKKHEDVIATFAYYKKYINPKSRLILVGSDTEMEKYSARLRKYTDLLALDDVVFTGHVKFKEILAYYSIADVFLCMSEHEGFCVPLVESMYFNVPIMAYDSSAIAGTLGGSGVLLKDKDPVFAAMMLDRIVKDEKLRNQIVSKQKQRCEDFAYEKIKALFEEQLNSFIDGTYTQKY